MGAVFTKQVTLDTSCDCCKCGIPIFMTTDMNARLRKSHEAFYCLHGHGQSYRSETEEEKLRKALHEKELESTRRAQALAAAVEAKAQAEAKLARNVKRTAAGTCPCCSRTFKQLAAHMKNKHPEVV